MKQLILSSLSTLALGLSNLACAAPVVYNIDPTHTFPSFEADHLGVSIWRGKFNKTTGRVILDKAAGTGTLDVNIDMDSVDFGLDIMNDKARSAELFDTTKYPQARYKGRLEGFANGVPTQVVGELTLHGVTKPVNLKINSFKCIPHPMVKLDLCGADALASFSRDDFGIDAGKPYGFRMDVTLRIQVEALQEAVPVPASAKP
ncbi:MAG: polyisoprenoid-binding protein [Rubrivivax sp.]|nr:MAG: polyisoprenoid-binding protein [Rubrivivax sp.]